MILILNKQSYTLISMSAKKNPQQPQTPADLMAGVDLDLLPNG